VQKEVTDYFLFPSPFLFFRLNCLTKHRRRAIPFRYLFIADSGECVR
jgi:hypothetical protein